MNNPLDISKDKQDNAFINGLKYNIRNSELNKERIKEYIKYEVIAEPGDKITGIIEFAMRQLNIREDELTVADEHELIDWVYELLG